MQFHLPQQALNLVRKATSHVPGGHKKEKNVEVQHEQSNTSRSDSTKVSNGSKGRLLSLERTETGAMTIGKFTLRGKHDDLPQ
jgi:hypothetical protein